eukprot:13244436-Alexandrium_andersonii.AAC.1
MFRPQLREAKGVQVHPSRHAHAPARQRVVDPTLEQRAQPPPPLVLDGRDHRHHRPVVVRRERPM